MLGFAKNLAYVGLHRSGIAAAVSRSSWRRRRLLILCYHGVSLCDEHECFGLYVSQDHLFRRLELLRRTRCNVLPLSKAISLQQDGELPEKAVSITFDDGAHDFFVHAHPLLESLSLHATLYLTTYYCFRPVPVFDPMLAYLLWKGRGRKAALRTLGSKCQFVIPNARGPRQSLQLKLRSEAALNLDEEAKQTVLKDLALQIGVDYERLLDQRIFQLMNPHEIRSLDRNVVDVQLHTHRHRLPTDENQFKKEITDNIQAIKSMTNDPDWKGEHFCYPSGEYQMMFLPWLDQMGIQTATTCDSGLVTRSTSRLLLPRFIDTMDTSESAFLSWLSGAGDWLPRRS